MKMTPEVHNLDPVSVYLDYLIRNTLPKSAPLSPKDIILSRVLSGPEIEKRPGVLVIEHRQVRPFQENAMSSDVGVAMINDMLFKSHLTSRLTLNTRRIQADVNNCKGWHYGRPILLTIATMVGTISDGNVSFVITNTYLGDTYTGPTQGLAQLPELLELLDEHNGVMSEELTKPKPAVVRAVA